MEITRDTIIADIMKAAPSAAPLFQSVGMHCLGCALASGETLGQACDAHGVDADALLAQIAELTQ